MHVWWWTKIHYQNPLCSLHFLFDGINLGQMSPFVFWPTQIWIFWYWQYTCQAGWYLLPLVLFSFFRIWILPASFYRIWKYQMIFHSSQVHLLHQQGGLHWNSSLKNRSALPSFSAIHWLASSWHCYSPKDMECLSLLVLNILLTAFGFVHIYDNSHQLQYHIGSFPLTFNLILIQYIRSC